MTILRDRNTRWVIGAGVVLLGVLILLSQSGWLNPLEHLALDGQFMLRGARPFPPQIVVVGIDESSLDAFGHWPWRRDRHAALLKLLRHPSFLPAAFAYDILFESQDVRFPEGDYDLAREAAAFGEFLVLAYFFEKGPVLKSEINLEKEKILEKFALPPSREIPEKLEEASKVSLPYEPLLLQSSLGFATHPVDPDGRTRRIRLLMRYKNRLYPSFALASALKFMGAELGDVEIHKDVLIVKKSRLGERRIPISSSGEMLINYRGTFRGIPQFSFVEILQEGRAWMDENRDPLKLKSLQGKLVLVGATALGLEDRRVTPFRTYEPAIGVQAQVIANIVEGKFLKRAPASVSILGFALLGILTLLLIASQKIIRAFVLTVLFILLYFGAAHVAFLNDYWVEVAHPLISTVFLFTVLVSLRYFLTAEELKKTYLQLLHAEKMASLGTLSASIAHEYRNFLSVINMGIETCRLPSTGRDQLEHCLEIIKNTADKANQMTEGLLTFARKNESVKKEARLQKTIEEVLVILEKKITTGGIKIQKEWDDLAPLWFDEGQISQVVLNMLRNAQDAFKGKKDGKCITLRLKDLGNLALLEIEDNGSGIPKKVRERLFEPFITSKKAGEGTGLGLSVCHGIILNHGGDIKVKTAEGQGTTWQIFLPKK